MRMILKRSTYERGANAPHATDREAIMVTIETSPAGSYWYIKVNGVIVEGFVKFGLGRATLAQVKEAAEEYKS
jgi:hypothetical protein